MKSFETHPGVAQFLSDLEQIPWFENLGKPSTGAIDQIHSWEEWPGPEDERVAAISVRQQQAYDRLTDAGGAGDLVELFERIQAIVFRRTSPRIPYDPTQDSWFAPNMAVWHAAWTAGIVGLCLFADRPLPAEIECQWHWFVKGHWPCDWNEDTDTPVIY